MKDICVNIIKIRGFSISGIIIPGVQNEEGSNPGPVKPGEGRSNLLTENRGNLLLEEGGCILLETEVVKQLRK